MHRFFIEENQISQGTIEVSGSDVKHIRDVLRLKVGDLVEAVDQGKVYIGKIQSIEKNRITLKIVDKYQGTSESPVNIVLYQGLAKGNKMDLIVQKTIEVGVKEIFPVSSYRSVVKLKDLQREQTKVNRWKLIAEEAAKQSKRDIIPKIHSIISFDEMIELLKGEKNVIVPYEDEKLNYIGRHMPIRGNTMHLIIGPEGGFEPFEIEQFKAIGAKIVTLGPRTMRTETAGIVATAILLYEFGDLGVM
ncbi:MAG: 16S rRNA (uracil(1498)-N(3))-methyltransferase [Tissierellaceae bacterium]|nr:16S rRNA (uracil(1498)-N(3))-methyltransferase [Tissierellaceae bacterium]